MDRFIDARVRLRGNAGTIFGSSAQLRGMSLFVGRTSEIVMLESPPDPFSMTVRSIRSIYNYSPGGEVNRRLRVRGVVTAYIAGHPVEISDFTSTARFRFVRHVLYVDDGSGGARIETEQSQGVDPGTVVDVVGFPTATPGRPTLVNAIFRAAGTAPQPSAVMVPSANVLSPENDATLVRMQGHFLSVLRNPMERVLVMRVGETVFDASLEASAATERLERIRPGSLVSVTGVYSYRGGPPPTFHLFLRSVEDVAVDRAAPWWTLQHTAVMLVMLTLVAGGAGVWVRASATRKRQQYQAVLNERSRVGRELHDTLEQGLAGIALQLEAVAGSLDTSPEAARRSLEVARQMLRYSEEEARRSVADLRSQALESRGLAGALTDMVRQMTHGTGARAEVSVEGVIAAARCLAGAPPASDRPRGAHQRAQAFRRAADRDHAAFPRRLPPTCRSKTTAAASSRGRRTCRRAAGSDCRAFGSASTSLAACCRLTARRVPGTRLAVTDSNRPSRRGRTSARTRLDESWRTS